MPSAFQSPIDRQAASRSEDDGVDGAIWHRPAEGGGGVVVDPDLVAPVAIPVSGDRQLAAVPKYLLEKLPSGITQQEGRPSRVEDAEVVKTVAVPVTDTGNDVVLPKTIG